jgi:recombination DNA repair RAD52 pathway protein
MKVKPIRFEENNLYRHADFALPPTEGQPNVKREPHKAPVRPNQALRTRTEHLGESMSADFDDEFDGNLFDGVEITEHTDDAFTFESMPASHATSSKALEAAKPVHATSEGPAIYAKPMSDGGPPGQPNSNRQSATGANGPGAAQQQRPLNQGSIRPPPNGPNPRGPQTPVQQSHTRPEQARPTAPPTSDIHKTSAQQPYNGQQPTNGQSFKPTPPQAQQQPPNQARPGLQASGAAAPSANASNTGNRPPVGFVTSRAAELLQNSDTTTPPNNIPAFNPHVESPLPKEQRTPGLDHTRSVPVKRQENGAGAAPPAQGAPRAAPLTGGTGFGRTNFTNQHQETNRKIGMPGASFAMSPSANRGAYKPPTFANGTGPPNANGNTTGEGHEVKRQRIEVSDAENSTTGTLNSL